MASRIGAGSNHAGCNVAELIGPVTSRSPSKTFVYRWLNRKENGGAQVYF